MSIYDINPILNHKRSRVYNKILDVAEKKIWNEKFYYLEAQSSTE